MRNMFAAISILAATALSASGAEAQWTPGSELVGQSVRVEANGIENTIYFDAGGAARIVTPTGSVVPASWTTGPTGLCLNAAGAQECWNYAAPMTAGQPLSLTSSCQVTSTWLASATNVTPPPPQAGSAGERG